MIANRRGLAWPGADHQLMNDSPIKKLPPEAYEPIPGDQYNPYVAPGEDVKEFTVKAIVLGAIFGILFGFANTYLGLKVGLTVSTSIPIAVMTVAVMRGLRGVLGKSTILEHNMAQTVGSASSSLASGVIFTIPALFLWGLDPHLLKIATLALLGGVLGILAMVPLRRLLIRNEHGRLPYPEGTACAEILVASEAGGSMAKKVFIGLGVGALYKTCVSVLHLWPHKFETRVPGLPKALFGIETTPALLGVGYILGFRISAIMVAGSFISWMVFIPLIAYFGNYINEPLFPETEHLIRDMEPGLIWNRYIRYLGAGGVAFGGILTVIRAFPTMVKSFRIGFAEIKARLNKVKLEQRIRTDDDVSFPFLLAGVTLVIGTMIFIPKIFGVADSFTVRILAGVCIAFFAFFFVTVSARIVGFIGVSSNPTSGMTIVTLIGTSLIFYLLGWTDTAGKAAALTIGTVVCVAASIAGDTSQDLKTGFLLGATPKRQQRGELIGVVTSALAVASAVIVLNAHTSFGSEELPAPQATLMKTVIEGILSADIPWVLVGVGGLMALTVELLGIPSLPFAVGLYLPLSTFSAIFGGGLLRRYIESRAGDDEERNSFRERGILYASGLIAGEGLIAVARAGYAYITGDTPEGFGYEWMGGAGRFVSLGLFAVLAYLIYRSARK